MTMLDPMLQAMHGAVQKQCFMRCRRDAKYDAKNTHFCIVTCTLNTPFEGSR